MSGAGLFVNKVVDALKSVVGNSPTPLHAPEFRGNEWSYLKECLDSTLVSSIGKFVDQFEADLAEFTGAKHVVAVVNGTAALHVALLLAGVRAGDEVLIPTLTFVATANAVSYCGAIPHFVDSEEITLGIDVDKLRAYLLENTQQESGQCVSRTSGRVIRALIPMHVFGHASDIAGLLELSQEFSLVLVEDAAESLGSYYHGRHTGTFGRVGALSFNGNKTITTGGGGALLLNDSELARQAKHLTTTAKLPHAWEYQHDKIGFNYRMPNINAALGCAQLESLPDFIREKRRLHDIYRDALEGIWGVTLMNEPSGCISNYWLQALLLNKELADQRDTLLAATNSVGLMTRPVWILMHQLAPYAAAPHMDLSCAEGLATRVINIPSSPVLARECGHG